MKKTVVSLVSLLLCALAVTTATAAQPTGKVQAVAVGPGCDRECLRDHVTQVLWGLVRHDMSRVRVADNIRITEDANEKTLKTIGLVRSVTALRGFRQDFIDERTGMVGAHVMVEEVGAPVMLVVRLKVVADKITEMELV